MNLLSSVVITVGFFSIDATKYRFDTLLRTITKQIVAKALNETHDTQNYLEKNKDASLIYRPETETVVLTAFISKWSPTYCYHKFKN